MTIPAVVDAKASIISFKVKACASPKPATLAGDAYADFNFSSRFKTEHIMPLNFDVYL